MDFRFQTRSDYEQALSEMLRSGDYDEKEYDSLEDEYFAFCDDQVLRRLGDIEG